MDVPEKQPIPSLAKKEKEGMSENHKFGPKINSDAKRFRRKQRRPGFSSGYRFTTYIRTITKEKHKLSKREDGQAWKQSTKFGTKT